MGNVKLVNIDPDDYILAIRAARSFMMEDKPVGIRHGTCCGFNNQPNEAWYTKETKWFFVYRTKTMIVVRHNK